MRLSMKIIILVSLLTVNISTMASTWNFIWVGNENARYFFDADTVEKNREIVTLWVKSVQTYKPDAQGAWASASRWRFNCSKRTIQSLTVSDYDKDGKFIRSYPNSSREDDIVPDSVGDGLLKIVCQSDFPKNKSEKDYFVVKDNDIFQFTKSFVEYLKTTKDEAPK